MRFFQRGISLPEILITLAIAGVGGFLIMGLLTSTTQVFKDQTTLVNQGLSVNQADLEIKELIKSSAGVMSQYPVSGSAQFITGPQTLILKIPAYSASGQVIDAIFDYAVITRDPTALKILRKHIFPDVQSFRNSENKVLATALDSLSFVYLDSSNNPVSPTQAVRITFIINLSDNGGLSQNESSSSSTINLKNL